MGCQTADDSDPRRIRCAEDEFLMTRAMQTTGHLAAPAHPAPNRLMGPGLSSYQPPCRLMSSWFSHRSTLQSNRENIATGCSDVLTRPRGVDLSSPAAHVPLLFSMAIGVL